jgi:glycylpeptide N-tetradecanoyltransferase
MTLQRTIKLFRLPLETKRVLRPLTHSDIPAALSLLTAYLRKFKLSPLFNQEEFEHWFLPRESIVDTYVVEKAGVITGKGSNTTHSSPFYVISMENTD